MRANTAKITSANRTRKRQWHKTVTISADGAKELHHLTLDIEDQHREALLYRDEITTRAGQMLASG